MTGKPVFNTEYDDEYHTTSYQTTLCSDSDALGIQNYVFAEDLDDFYRHCCP